MNSENFTDHLHYILNWWEPLIDWEKGGVYTYTKFFKNEPRSDKKVPLMHLRQLYNFSVGFEYGHPGAEKIATHLYESLFQVFPEKQNALMISSFREDPSQKMITTYLNAYQVLCLSRFARTFNHKEASELALQVYREIDAVFTDGNLSDQGSWGELDLQSGQKSSKTDNAHIHRCEGAFNLLRTLDTVHPDLAENERAYLQREIKDLCTFFDQKIARPDEGYTLEHLADDGSPAQNFQYHSQSLAHGFEWLGFCAEIERHCGLTLPFIDTRLRTLSANTLENGLTPNGCFRNSYVIAYRDAPMEADFWPQVEAILGALWARKRWGENAFPLEKSERMFDFYQRNMILPVSIGGGIACRVAENGVPINYSTGNGFKCDHHALRMVEKTLEYDLLGEVPD